MSAEGYLATAKSEGRDQLPQFFDTKNIFPR
jgi:hypothetical protein